MEPSIQVTETTDEIIIGEYDDELFQKHMDQLQLGTITD
jgi:hypothetical protein